MLHINSYTARSNCKSIILPLIKRTSPKILLQLKQPSNKGGQDLNEINYTSSLCLSKEILTK